MKMGKWYKKRDIKVGQCLKMKSDITIFAKETFCDSVDDDVRRSYDSIDFTKSCKIVDIDSNDLAKRSIDVRIPAKNGTTFVYCYSRLNIIKLFEMQDANYHRSRIPAKKSKKAQQILKILRCR